MKYIIDINVKYKIVELIKENIGGNLCDTGLGKDFLYRHEPLKISK